MEVDNAVITRAMKEKARKYSRQFLKKACEICGTSESLTIHHIIPLRVAINVEPENCQTLCRPCHTGVESNIARIERSGRAFQPVKANPDDPRTWSRKMVKRWREECRRKEYREWVAIPEGHSRRTVWKDGELVTS